MTATPAPVIAVCGPGEDLDPEVAALAEAVGRALARRGAIVICGGLGGAMAAASRGAREAGGLVVGILPGASADDANAWVDIRLPTGLGPARNAIIATACEALIAVGGRLGTLTEIAFALRMGRPVVSLRSFRLDEPALGGSPVARAETALEAVDLAIRLARPGGAP